MRSCNVFTSYRPYVPLSYKLLNLWGIPCVSLVILCALTWFFPETFRVGEMAFLGILCLFDVLFDHYAFGGALTSAAGGMELLKSSPRGLAFYRSVILADTLLRLLRVFAGLLLLRLLAVVKGISFTDFEEIPLVFEISSALIYLTVLSLTFLVLRRIVNTFLLLLFAYIVVALLISAEIFLLPALYTIPVLAILLPGITAAGFSFLLIRLCVRRRENSYCDTKDV